MVMMSSLRLSLILAFLFAAPAAAQETTNSIDWKTGGAWSDLSSYIGTYNYDAVLGDERVADALKAQLGDAVLETLHNNLATRNPIGFEDDCMLLSGNAVSAGDTQSAFVAVCIYKGVVHTALHQGNDISLFTAAEKYDYLPYAMKLWLYGQTNADVYKLPDGVTLKLAP